MKSNERSEPLDLEAGLRTTPADVEALRRARVTPPMSPAEYLEFLSRFEATPEELRRRRGPRGPEPFRL